MLSHMTKQTIHGHTLLNHILEQGGREDIDSLRTWARSTHGSEARYHTCSADGLTLDGLLQFFVDRRKIAIADNWASVVRENVCSQSDDDLNPVTSGYG